MRIIYLLFIFIHPLRAVDVSKMKTIQAKVQKTIQKSSTRETNLKIAQDTNPKSFSTSNPNNEREKYSSDLIVEYFVRKKDTGLWIFYDYQDVPDTFVREYDQRATEDVGITTDVYSSPVNSFILSAFFGSGMGGEAEKIKKVKDQLSQFKKLKPKDIEFGYQLLGREGICTLVTKSKGVLEQEKKKAEAKAAPKLDIDAYIASLPVSRDLLEANKNFTNWWGAVQEGLQGSSVCLFGSDGSAIMKGNECMEGSSAVVLCPCQKEDQDVMGGSSFCLRVVGVETVSMTAFDCELVAGLAAMVLAQLVSTKVSSEIRLQGYTDSKTLIRALRTGPTAELADRADACRKVIWTMLSSLLQDLEAREVSCSYTWAQGHPERTQEDADKWANEERLLWKADAVARGVPGEEWARTTVEIHVKDLISISNILLVISRK